MKRIVKIQNVGNVAFPDHMTDVKVRQAAGKLHAQAHQQQRASKEPAEMWEPGEDDPIIHIRTSDNREWHIHNDDLEKMKRRDPNLKIIH